MIKEFVYDSPIEFVNSLRKSNERWWDSDSKDSEWVFRGVGNSDAWTLLPSAWRPNQKSPSNYFY